MDRLTGYRQAIEEIMTSYTQMIARTTSICYWPWGGTGSSAYTRRSCTSRYAMEKFGFSRMAPREGSPGSWRSVAFQPARSCLAFALLSCGPTRAMPLSELARSEGWNR